MKRISPPRSGSSLLITLIFLVVLAVTVVTFFYRTASNSLSASSSASRVRAAMIAQTGMSTTVADLVEEMRRGSVPVTQGNGEELAPRTKLASRPYRMTQNSAIKNLLKGSYAGSRPWPANNNYNFRAGPARVFSDASGSTALASRDGRFVRPVRWGAPQLQDDDAQISGPGFTPPSWIFVTRDNGAVSTATTAPDYTAWSNRASGQFVVGRYAFQMYDVGGLMNINAVGHLAPPVTDVRAARRGRVAFVDLANVKTAASSDIVDKTRFLQWRHAGSLADASTYASALDLPERDFRTVGSGDQQLLTRQDLLRISDSQTGLGGGSVVPRSLANKLTIFSLDHNAPSWRPDPARPKVTPARTGESGPDDAMNPSPLSVRVTKSFTRRDGTIANVGDPLIKSRFPLGKLALLRSPSSQVTGTEELEAIRSYFGLEPADDNYSWEYENASNRILKLSEVAEEGREPDFFEMLQAAILTGSLGSVAEYETGIRARDLDQNIYYQIMQIGANIVDQVDADDWPTTLLFNEVGFYGQENLPYIYTMPLALLRPPVGFAGQTADEDNVYGWFQFGLWNPHQNAVDAGTSNLRIRVSQGKAGVMVRSRTSAIQQGTLWDFAASPGALNFSNSPKFAELTFLDQSAGTGSTFPNEEVRVASGEGNTNHILPDMPNLPGGTTRLGFAGICVGFVNAAEPELLASGAGDSTKAIWTAATIYADVVDPPIINLEIQVPGAGGGWKPYQSLDGYLAGMFENHTSGYTETPTQTIAFFRYMTAYPGTTTDARHPALGTNGIAGIDPRATRYGMSGYENLRQLSRWRKQPGSTIASIGRQDRDQEANFGTIGYSTTLRPGNEYTYTAGTIWQRPAGYQAFYIPALMDNRDALLLRTADPDRVVRPADGDSSKKIFPGLFTDDAEGKLYIKQRSVILNRPFTNVGELGYVFRAQPWKTLDFSSTSSADLALLDFFSVEKSELVAGPLDINTKHAELLAAVLQGVLRKERETTAKLSKTDADRLAGLLVQESAARPFRNLGDVVTFLSTLPETDYSAPAGKTEREALIRALAGTTQTGVWNIMIDLIAQAGRFPPGSNKLNDFVVEGETRQWMHVAIDRATGEILDYRMETVVE